MTRRWLLGGLATAVSAAAAWRLTDSLGLWQVFFVGGVSILEVTLLGLVQKRDLTKLAKYAIVGSLIAAVLLVFGRGAVVLSEAAWIGALAGLALASADLVVAVVRRWRHGEHTPPPRTSVLGTGLTFAAIVGGTAFFAPLVSATHLIHFNSLVTPGELGLRFEDIEFETSDGVRLRGWYVPAEEPRGVVVYCHGHGSCRGQVLSLLGTLSELHLDVLAFDFRGHGGSDGHTATFGHRETADLVAACEYARTRSQGRPVFVIGTSYGAAVALQSLPQLTDVRGVWLESPFARLTTVVDCKLSPVPQLLRRPLLEAYYLLAWLDSGIHAREVSPIECVEGCDVPIGIAHGRRDELIPFGESELLLAAYPGAKQHVWIDEANHFNLQQVGGEAYLARLRAFLEENLHEVS